MSELLQFQAAVELTAAASGPPRVSILAYSGGLATAAGFGPFVLSLDGLSLPDSIPLLANHENTLNAIAGQGSPSVRSGQLYVEGTLTDASDGGKLVLGLHRSGIRLQASIGAQPSDVMGVREGESIAANGRTIKAPRGGFRYVRAAELREVSIVAISGDPNSAVHIAAKGKVMDDPILQERDRVQAIINVTAGHPKIQAEAIANNWTPEKAELECLRAERQAATLTAIREARPTGVPTLIKSGGPAGENVLAASFAISHYMTASQAAKHWGAEAVHAAESRPHRGMTLHGLFRSALAAAGHQPPAGRLSDSDIRTALQLSLTAGGPSTYSVPGILSNVLNKAMLDSFNQAAVVWNRIARFASAPDFKPQKRYRMRTDGVLAELAPGGQFQHATVSETEFGNQLSTFGKIVGIDRRDLVNDDLGAFRNLPTEFGRAAARLIESKVIELLLSNPGGTATGFFSTAHANYNSSNPLSVDGLDAAVKMLLEQVDENGHPALVQPAILLTAPALYATARSLTAVGSLIATGDTDVVRPSINVWGGMIEAMQTPYLAESAGLANSDDAAWYLLCAPGDYSVIEAGFLDGRTAPTIESSDMDFDRLGMAMRCFIDFGTSLLEYRGGVLSTSGG